MQAASSQLSDFIGRLNSLRDTKFKAWFASVCDIRLLLKTYAVITTAGIYDDYWNAGNNYFLYFNSKGLLALLMRP
ncbi:MAG: CotH kinase family protein [Bacteroidales bacterium]|nr:CotH kinase family protein [Bacteroidales bacterium]